MMLLDLILLSFSSLLVGCHAAPASPAQVHVRFTSPGQAGFLYSQTKDKATVVPIVADTGESLLRYYSPSRSQVDYVGTVTTGNDLEELAYLSQVGLGDVAIITPSSTDYELTDTAFTYPSSFPEETSFFYFGEEVNPERKRPVSSGRRPVSSGRRPAGSRRRPSSESRRRGGSRVRGGGGRRPSGSHRTGRRRGYAGMTNPDLVRNLVEPPTNPPNSGPRRHDDLVSNDLSQISFLLDTPPFFDSIEHDGPVLALLKRREEMGATPLLLGSIRPFFPFFRND